MSQFLTLPDWCFCTNSHSPTPVFFVAIRHSARLVLCSVYKREESRRQSGAKRAVIGGVRIRWFRSPPSHLFGLIHQPVLFREDREGNSCYRSIPFRGQGLPWEREGRAPEGGGYNGCDTCCTPVPCNDCVVLPTPPLAACLNLTVVVGVLSETYCGVSF